MEKQEQRASASLATVFSVRMLGLFMIYPVFAVFAHQLKGATTSKIGLALGIYGLTQGLLQMPFGLLSDRVGRKVMIVAGLTIFGVGSAVAARSSSIDGVIWGRALQGAGAVGSVILALVADLTSEESRTKAMALVGMTIGASFLVAIVTGPVIADLIGLGGIFWLMAALALVGIAITAFLVPAPPPVRVQREAQAVPVLIGSTLRNLELLRLDFGIFALHAMLTASFLVVPQLLHKTLGVSGRDQWFVYLPVLAASVAIMIPAIIIAERYRRMKGVLVGAVAALAVSQVAFAARGQNAYVLSAALVIFFAGFNIMEASLPSLVTKTASSGSTGTATGIYSSSQFLGIFAGGVLGGWLYQIAGSDAVFSLGAALALVWLLIAATMRHPRYRKTRGGSAIQAPRAKSPPQI
jgi:predicted MFS family arabinose efflux permease